VDRLAAVIVAAVVGAALGVGIVVLLSDFPDQRQVATTPVSIAGSEPTSATSDPGPSDGPSPAVQPEPASPPMRVGIPAIDVDAELISLGRNDDGSMEVPDFGLAGWYKPGPVPGEPGPAVIAAHVDSVAGPDVFYRLKDLTAGDKITVTHEDGTRSTFMVRDSEQQPKDALPVERIWNKTTDPVLRLITCGGDFDQSARSYRSNVIVYAVAMPS